MGWDLHWRRKNEDVAAEEEKALEAWTAAQEALDALPEDERGTIDSDAFMEALNAASPDDEVDVPDWNDPVFWTGQSERYAAARRKVVETFRKVSRRRHGYFELTNHNMGLLMFVMRVTGMVFEDYPRPEFPKLEDFGITNDQRNWARYPDQFPAEHAALDEDTFKKIATYHEAHDQVLIQHSKDTPGIPRHKFSSNDGWIVTPEECQAALDIWRNHEQRLGAERALKATQSLLGGAEWWPQWLDYLEGAVAHDGFEVW